MYCDPSTISYLLTGTQVETLRPVGKDRRGTRPKWHSTPRVDTPHDGRTVAQNVGYKTKRVEKTRFRDLGTLQVAILHAVTVGGMDGNEKGRKRNERPFIGRQRNKTVGEED